MVGSYVNICTYMSLISAALNQAALRTRLAAAAERRLAGGFSEKESTGSGWTCPHCTFRNEDLHLQCSICGQVRKDADGDEHMISGSCGSCIASHAVLVDRGAYAAIGSEQNYSAALGTSASASASASANANASASKRKHATGRWQTDVYGGHTGNAVMNTDEDQFLRQSSQEVANVLGVGRGSA